MKLITLENLNYALGLVSNKFTQAASDLTNGLAGKVDKVTGKDLSSNDYTTEDKTKLSDLDTKTASLEHFEISEDGNMTVKNMHGDEANKVNIPVYSAATVKLKTPRTINGIAFDGSADITIPTGGGTNDVPSTEAEIKSLFTEAQ